MHKDDFESLKRGLAQASAYDRAKAAIGSDADELVSVDAVKRILAGESPLRVFRKLRGMTQVGLADASAVNRVQIADIEAGRKSGSVGTLRKLADALGALV